jgi:tetratricopeptide (TPR) repeat protein
MAWLEVLKMRELYWRGSWDEAFNLATVLAAETGNVRCHTIRAQIQLARGRVEDAVDDAAKALETGRMRKDPQALHTALAVHGRASLAAGARSDALAAVDELFKRFASEGTQQMSATLPDLAVTALSLGRADEFLQAVTALNKQSPWIDAACAFVSGDFTGAASTYARIDTQPDTAYARLRAAQRLVERGSRAEADELLPDALAFFQSVGATPYLEEAEALLATAR